MLMLMSMSSCIELGIVSFPAIYSTTIDSLALFVCLSILCLLCYW